MRKLAIIIIVLATLSISCKNKDRRKEYFNQYVQNKYTERLKSFPSHLVDFFPKQIGGIYNLQETKDSTNECVYFMYFDFSNKRSAFIDSIFRSKAKAIYNPFDTNIISIRSKGLILDDPTLEMFYNNIFINGRYYYPVPYFEKSDYSSIEIKSEDIYSNKLPCGLTKDFTIYVLDSKPGSYWNGLKPSEHMPKGWENGFSKGVCVNTKKGIVIYWFVIW